MTIAGLIAQNALSNKRRLALTAGSVTASLFLLTVLQVMLRGFTDPAATEHSAARLVVRHNRAPQETGSLQSPQHPCTNGRLENETVAGQRASRSIRAAILALARVSRSFAIQSEKTAVLRTSIIGERIP